MYQTVGHTAIEALAECLEVPLYRGSIHGGPVKLDLDYAPSVGDEVEDMMQLLSDVKVW